MLGISLDGGGVDSVPAMIVRSASIDMPSSRRGGGSSNAGSTGVVMPDNALAVVVESGISGGSSITGLGGGVNCCVEVSGVGALL